MARNYSKKRPARNNGNLLGQLMLVLGTFAAGYFSASLYNYTQLSGWVSTHVLLQQGTKVPLKSIAQQTPLPKPKFEFYTLLANERVAGSVQTAQSAPAITMPAAPPVLPAAPTAPVTLASTQKLPLHAPLAATIVADVKESNAVLATKEAYLVQVGSFKNIREAERMKALLAMKGFDVHIASVNQQRISWYRVIIGPFASRTQAQKAQASFARSEHIMGMIRKMDA